MPRKPKREKQQITVVIGGKPVIVTLHPPNERQKSWFVYWPGLGNSKSTGQRDLKDAIVAAERMLRNGGKRSTISDEMLTDDEFEAIQRHHFTRKQSSEAKRRGQKSLRTCLEAIDAFRRITGISPVTRATPDDCARFERDALTLPKNWRLTYPKAKTENVERVSPNTVVKWSTALAAAFERANRNAGKKCVRGVVSESKLLTSNPWKQFNRIEGVDKPKRHLSDEELISLLDFLEAAWPEVTVATAAFKTALWAWARLSELVHIKWDDIQVVGRETHIEIVGKWGGEKWACLPSGLMADLESIKVGNPFVFAGYNEQLRQYYLRVGEQRFADRVGAVYSPDAFGSWLQDRMEDWCLETGCPAATPHALRKTALQFARTGEDVNRQVALDARLSCSVMLSHYVSEREEEHRQASLRTFNRILLGLSSEVVSRYGHHPDDEVQDLERRIEAAMSVKDWEKVETLAQQLANRKRPT